MLEFLNDIDRAITLFLNGSSSLFIDGIAMTATATVTWIPLAAVLIYVILKNNSWTNSLLVILGIALCITLADQLASVICKPYFARYRPTQDPEIRHLVDVVNNYRGGRYGFFSSHAANTVSLATFLTLLIRNKWLSLLLYSWAALNCWTRLYLGVHYFGDITVGILWGLLVGWGVYQLLGLQTKLMRQRTAPTAVQTVYAEGDVQLFIAALSLTYLSLPVCALFLEW